MRLAMRKITNIIGGLLFITLLTFNIQIGNDSNFLQDKKFQKANAGNCPVGGDPCGFYEFPDGTTIGEFGEVIVVTPRKK
jgi:hypothetical protein